MTFNADDAGGGRETTLSFGVALCTQCITQLSSTYPLVLEVMARGSWQGHILSSLGLIKNILTSNSVGRSTKDLSTALRFTMFNIILYFYNTAKHAHVRD